MLWTHGTAYKEACRPCFDVHSRLLSKHHGLLRGCKASKNTRLGGQVKRVHCPGFQNTTKCLLLRLADVSVINAQCLGAKKATRAHARLADICKTIALEKLL